MKTFTFIIYFAAVLAGCTKDMDEGPDRSGTDMLVNKFSNSFAISLFKEGILIDKAETNFSTGPIDGSLEPFDKDITISFYESGSYWQVVNVRKHKPDTLFISIMHKEQAWCSHCTYYNGNYSLMVESKVPGTLIDKALSVSIPVNKKKVLTYNYVVTDNSEQNNRFIMVLK
jgi:hypothetical protein